MSKSYKVEIKAKKYADGEIGPYYWCYQNFGPLFTKWHAIRYYNYDIYFFSEEEDYALFVLTWR